MLLFSVIGVGLPIASAGRDQKPDEIVQLAVDIIDTRYLYARSNPAWERVKAGLLKTKLTDSAQAYRALAHELGMLGDSELNVVSASQLAELQKDSTGERVGIGLADFSIDHDPSGAARIVTPIFGTPAAEAGVSSGDILETVNGKDTRKMLHEEVVDELHRRQPSGTRLILRRGKIRLRIVIQPSEAKLNPVHAEIKTSGGKKLGYIRVVEFTPDAGAQVRQAVTRFEGEFVVAYILDLRNNPGGFLNSAGTAASAFITGTLGFSVHQDGKPEARETAEPILTKRPVIVLINHGTASAAEVLTAALQHNGRATVVGMTSYGRGQAQTYYPLTDGYGIIVPSALLQTPAGKGFKGTGLVPDVEVAQDPLTLRTVTTEQDAMFVRALKLLDRATAPGPAQ
ncbi:MAG TPA: S41 family peptidase [Alphaproteobacteria bacterium]|nr:S41 family peptidase [Alphaproteobacteria bacterium]